MLFQRQPDASALAIDRVHERIVTACGGLLVEGWQYAGYRTRHERREMLLVLHFEKGIIDRLAAADVRIQAGEFMARNFGVAEFLADRLRAVEAELIRRHPRSVN